MEIDVLAWLNARMSTPQMVTEDEALEGRDTPVLSPMPRHEVLGLPLDEVPAGAEVAYFALGCFWGEERMFWQVDGVLNTAAGYMGGFTPNPTYKETCTGHTGHTETVKVVFDPTKVGYDDLLTLFWENHDPTQVYRQGNDLGTQYRSAIFPVDEEQRAAAERSRAAFQERLTAEGYGPISTEITPGQAFYYAELEHQQYLHKNPGGYCPNHATGVKCGPAD
ncbi:peptide-methionine (S)-S-oxide reductase MsrA [Tessaracoccus sp. MC1865]|uniref:peptide-methionine (S)-S-oxide reductase MsrA n=1 Tax=Tessaracoccus sp. MC1865 TaxID=2760310 RepID=UPI00160174CF|nr:peptide-methionine (S)-S-oxide reductase MsrA [Tessaracoccus sp. MC1865]MBB1482397.1 peptide-methionine (S)-S-oxide reductase MsrA [Tessaracoccus sp. MC1865]